jgi:penicillin-binding protein 2
VATIGSLVDLYPGTIQDMYKNAGPDWYIPVGEVSSADYKKRGGGALNGFSGVIQNSYTTRFYTNGVAPQTIGYVSPVQSGEELNQSLRLGYARNQLIGRTGIEKWGQDILSGKNGGTLHVVAPDGAVLADLGSSGTKPASDIYLTLNESLQFYAQKGLEGFRGAIVIIERDTGKVLAMASSPGYDPNLFDPQNYNSGNGITALINDATTPQVNRAAQSKYPLGSVFKVITFSAALESGTYTPDTQLDCPYHFTELPDRVMDDWTWDHYQNELAAGETSFTQPSGMLSLTQALMRSCNPWFWHIGLDLYHQNRVTAIADMARGFGLGAPTGIDVIEESAGNIANPATQIDAVNQAIGQGDVQVTPLQVARFMAAIGNGGTLYRPQLIDKIVDANGVVTQVFKPDANTRPLPMTFETLKALQAAMHEVIYNRRGTAYGRFYTIRDSIPLYGKTGTAESGNGKSHAWFAGYTDSSNPDFHNIAITVIAENAGEGSVIAAPMFRRMVYVYLNGKPGYPYPWETDYGVTRTPTLPVTPTPEP